MKKALIVLLALAVAGGLFAQVSFSGGVASGLLLNFDDDGYGLYTSKSDAGDQYGHDFGVSYTADSGNAGGNVGFTGGNGEWGFDSAKLWFKPLDMLTISGGSGGQGGFGTPGPIDPSNGANDLLGINFKLEPMAGLALGASVGPADGLEFGDAAYALGVVYDMATVFKAVANLKYDGSGNEGDGLVNAAAGVEVSALSNIAGLVISAALSAEDVANLSDAGKLTAGAKVGFKVADLGAGLSATLKVPVQESQELNAKINADLSYPIGAATAGLGVNYVLKGAGKTGKFEAGSVDFDYSAADTAALTIHPSVSFGVGGADLKVGYGLSATLGDEMTLGHVIYTGFSIGF